MAKKNNDEITSMEEARQGMGFLNNIDNELASIYQAEAIAIHKVRSKFYSGKTGATREALEGTKKIHIKRLENFSKKNRKEWKQKSIETPFGSFGFRKGQPCVVLVKKFSKNLDEALKKLDQFFPAYIRIKKEINKDRIIENAKAFNDEAFSMVGLKVEQKEPFFIKTQHAEKLEEASKKLKSA